MLHSFTARARVRHSAKVLLPLAALLAGSALSSSAVAWNGDPAYLEYDGGAALLAPNDPSDPLGLASTAGSGIAGPLGGTLVHGVGSTVGVSFQGLSQYDTRALNGGYSSIPPDTMGAVGTTQFMETTNGGYAIFSKTGAPLSVVSDGAFWNAAGIQQNTLPNGLPSANGDSRVLFDKTAQRWVVESFAPSTPRSRSRSRTTPTPSTASRRPSSSASILPAAASPTIRPSRSTARRSTSAPTTSTPRPEHFERNDVERHQPRRHLRRRRPPGDQPEAVRP